MINKKGIFSFLAITFVITYIVELGMIFSGVTFSLLSTPLFAQLTVAAVMWVPSLATFLTVRFITHEKFSDTGLRFGSWKAYLGSWASLQVFFILTYGLTWALGWGHPDWQIQQLFDLMVASGADMSTAPDPGVVVAGLFFSSLFIAPWINSLFGMGEEWGWRGYLLPRLMPLGKGKAYLLLGVIWGLWHAPLIAAGFGFSGQNPLIAIVLFIGMTTLLGITMNELTLRYRSAILAGWMHGVFNSQAYGIWRIVFYDTNPLLGGFSGLVGLFLLGLMGLGTLWLMNRKPALSPAAALG
jgi:uncharacterized protein